MKKILILPAILIGLVVLVMAVPSSIKASTVEELQQMISSLLAQVAALQAQVKQMQNVATTPWCHTFNKNFGIGLSGGEINALHSILSKEVINGDFGWSSDNFDEQTASYVVELQEKYASEILTPSGLKHGTGYVGNSTRAKLNKIYGCGGNDKPKACPADAKQCPDGSYVSRTGSSCEFAQCPSTSCVGEGWNILRQGSQACCAGFSQISRATVSGTTCTQAVVDPFDICAACGNGVCGTGENSCNCPSDCKTTPPVACVDSDGAKAYYSAGNVYDSGKNYADYCLDNYKVKEYFCLLYSPSGLGGVAEDIYTCPNGCSNGVCNPIVSTSTVKSLTVISPNGGETFGVGKTYSLNWQAGGLDTTSKLKVSVCTDRDTPTCLSSPINNSALLPVTQISSSWIIPATLFNMVGVSANDRFKIQVSEILANGSTGVWDRSDNAFSIVSSVTTSTPITCTDSDNEKNYFVKGATTWGPFSGIMQNASDSCDLAGKTLSERYCLDGYSKVEYYQCPNGCKDGACLSSIVATTTPVACTDSDGGKDYFKKGIVSFGGKTYADSCSSSSNVVASRTLTEYFCSTDANQLTTIGSSQRYCDYGCEDGACKHAVQVLSPNGGEKWAIGQKQDIYWTVDNDMDKVDIRVWNYSFSSNYPGYKTIAKDVSFKALNGVYSWLIPNDLFDTGGVWKSGDNYKIEIVEKKADGSTGVSDKSDNYFNIVSFATTTATTTSCPVPTADIKNGYYDGWVNSAVHPPIGWQKEYPAFKSFLDMLFRCQQITKDEYDSQCSYYKLNCGGTSLKDIENNLANIATQVQALIAQLGR
jgi:hypothetical protein